MQSFVNNASAIDGNVSIMLDDHSQQMLCLQAPHQHSECHPSCCEGHHTQNNIRSFCHCGKEGKRTCDRCGSGFCSRKCEKNAKHKYGKCI